MKNIKINIDRPKVSSDEVSAKRDFESILSKYQPIKVPIYKNPLVVVSSVLITIGLVVFLIIKSNNTNVTEKAIVNSSLGLDELKADIKYVNAPITSLDVTYETYAVNAKKGGKIVTGSGTILSIPANAFLLENGQPAIGEVLINYREFKDPLDIFLSGIPMGYDSAGNNYNLVSAGMIDINGSQGNKRLVIASGKEIIVDMKSKYEGTEYNLYELDTINKNWVYRGKDKIVLEDQLIPMPKLNEASLKSAESIIKGYGLVLDQTVYVEGSYSDVVLDQMIDGMKVLPGTKVKKGSKITLIIQKVKNDEPKERYIVFPTLDNDSLLIPVMPKKTTPKKYKFTVDVLEKEFPGMNKFKGYLFEVKENSFHKGLYNVEWDNVILSNGENGVNYKATFSKGDSSFVFTVFPVYNSKDSAKVMQQYQAIYNEYVSRFEDDQKQEFIISTNIQSEESVYESKIDYSSIRRVFSINNFGVWNSDHPIKYKNEVVLEVTFQNSKGKIITPDIAYHIDKSLNSLYCHNYPTTSRIIFNRKANNILFVVLQGNKIAYANEDQFKSIEKSMKRYTFKLTEVEKEFENIKEFKDYFKNEFGL